MTDNFEIVTGSVPRCRKCRAKLIYKLRPSWLAIVLIKAFNIQKYYCVTCMTVRYVVSKPEQE